MQEYYSGAGQTTAAYNTKGADSPPKQNELTALMTALDALGERLDQARGKATEALDRIHGPRPSAVGNAGKAEPLGQSRMSQLNARVAGLMQVAADLNNCADRIWDIG